MGSHCDIAQHFSRFRPAPVQQVLDFKEPAVQAFDLCQWLCPGHSLCHNRLKPCQLLCTQPTHRPPFLSSCCKLASISSNIWLASTVAYLKG